MAESSVMEQIVSLCKRRGFIYPASEIYGGLNGFWDYGPLGVLLKNNIRDWWWRNMVDCPADRPRRASRSTSSASTRSIIQNPKTWVGQRPRRRRSPTRWSTTAKPSSRYRADHVDGRTSPRSSGRTAASTSWAHLFRAASDEIVGFENEDQSSPERPAAGRSRPDYDRSR